MSIGLSVTLDLSEVIDGFKEIKRSARDLRPVWRALKPGMKKDIQLNFKDKTSHEGEQWEPLAARTRKALGRNRKRKKTRSRRGRVANLGRLRSAFVIEFDRDSMIATSRVSWSGVHQDGGTAGKGAKIPAREHMWLSHKFIGFAVDKVAAHLVRRW